MSSETVYATPEGPRPEDIEKIKTAMRKTARRAFLVVAIAAGAYYGTRRPLKSIGKDVELLRDNVQRIGEFMAAQSIAKGEFVHQQRAAISKALHDGKDFTHYPGLGVIIDADLPKAS